jgi:hypothetical protein
MMNLKSNGRSGAAGPRSRERGAAVMPIIIAVAVAITLLQVPMLYKTKSGNKFSGAQKSNISAKTLAEAGIDQIITDIGRKSIRVTAATDTMPYSGVSLGRGTFSAKVRAYQINPDRVEVLSTGHVGANAQSVRARMELVKTEATIPFDTPRISLWGIRGTPPILYYHSLDERDSGRAWIFPEGQVVLPGVSTLNVDDFTVAPNGTMYFINNLAGTNAILYKIRPSTLDNNPATQVLAEVVGPTGLVSGTDDEVRGLTFIARTVSGKNGVLYACSWKSKKIYELSLQDGVASFVANVVPKGISSTTAFWADAMTQDLAGAIYLVRNNGKSELWKFTEFVEHNGIKQDSAEFTATISGMKDKTRAIAGHPNGYIYACDDERWYRVNPWSMPVSARTQVLFSDSSGLKGMGFHFEREDFKFTGTPIKHKVNVCHQPPAQLGVCPPPYTISVDSISLASHLVHGNGCAPDVPGYCGGASGTTMLADTAIALKIISWEEVSGNLAGNDH